MNLLLKYKDKIVSFGLLPIIITLIGIHLFPTTAMLGTGLAISIAGLLYDVLRLKGLNFFLLQGTIGIGVCFLLRLFKFYKINTGNFYAKKRRYKIYFTYWFWTDCYWSSV
jgi:hypothetical protein